jgi:hypothetical protein
MSGFWLLSALMGNLVGWLEGSKHVRVHADIAQALTS